jgi:hypothetical protein
VKGHVRSDLRKTLTIIPFEQFCQQHGARILADYEIEPAALGITISPDNAGRLD